MTCLEYLCSNVQAYLVATVSRYLHSIESISSVASIFENLKLDPSNLFFSCFFYHILEDNCNYHDVVFKEFLLFVRRQS
jgi:hypothetical protein